MEISKCTYLTYKTLENKAAYHWTIMVFPHTTTNHNPYPSPRKNMAVNLSLASVVCKYFAISHRYGGSSGYEDSRGGGGSYERRVEKYDRREARGMDSGGSRRGDVPSGRYHHPGDRRDSSAPSRREPLRRETASGREDRRYEERSRGEEPRGFGGRYGNEFGLEKGKEPSLFRLKRTNGLPYQVQ